MNHLLLLEDDAALAEGLAYALPKNGFEVTVVCSVAAARASLAGRALELTAAEYRLLCLLARHPNQTLTRTAILDAL